jgi:integrase
LGKIKLKDLTLEQVEALYQQLSKKGIGNRTVQFVHAVLRRCLKEAVRRRLVLSNPSQGAILPRIEREEMRILDENQVILFLIAAQESPNVALYHLAVKTGMRKGELLGLKWDDLDWQKGLLRVQRQIQRVPNQGLVFVPPKTRSGRRTLQLGEQMLQTLQDHWGNQKSLKLMTGDKWQDHGMIFTSSIGTSIDQRNLDREFKAILKRSGLEEIRFHDLRHTAASLMLNNGVPVLVVSKMLGHAKTSTTLDIYGHLIPVMQSEAARIMDDLITPIAINLVDHDEEPVQNLPNVKEFPI